MVADGTVVFLPLHGFGLCSMLRSFEVLRQLRLFGEGVVADGIVVLLLLHGFGY